MSFLRERLHDVNDAGPGPDGRMGGNADAAGNAVSRLKPDAPDVVAKAIGVVTDNRDSLAAVLLIDACRLRGAYAVRLQKNHDVADGFFPNPGFLDHLAP